MMPAMCFADSSRSASASCAEAYFTCENSSKAVSVIVGAALAASIFVILDVVGLIRLAAAILILLLAVICERNRPKEKRV